MEQKAAKKLGVGSFALLLSIVAIIWCCNIHGLDNFCLGDTVLGLLRLPSWSNGTEGTHYTVFYGLVFLIPAFILGAKHKQDLFAGAGKIIAGLLIVVCIYGVFLGVVM